MFGLHRSQVGREGAEYMPIFCAGKQKATHVAMDSKVGGRARARRERVEKCRKIDAGRSERISKAEGRVL